MTAKKDKPFIENSAKDKKNSTRQETDKERRARQDADRWDPAKKTYLNKKEKRALAETEAMKLLPPAALLDLTGSAEVLLQVEDPKTRTAVTTFLSILLEGGAHRKALTAAGFNWGEYMSIQRRYDGMHELWLACRDWGENYRVIIRSDETHRRAVDGVEEPLYSASGKYLGTKTLYSDKLLELLVKADSPEKFSTKSQVEVTGTVLNVSVGFDRDELKEEMAKGVIEDDPSTED